MPKPAFDPNKPFTDASQKPAFDPDAPFTGADEPSTSKGEALLTGAQQFLTAGHVPQIQGKIGEFLGNPSADVDAKLKAQGFTIDQPKSDYVTERDASIRSIDKIKSDRPGAYLAGQVGGALMTLPINPSAAATVGGRLGQAATTGAIMGAAQNPGDVEGVVEPAQIEERVKGALTGAAVGAATQGVGEAIGAGIKGVKSLIKGSKGASDSLALKQVGASKTDFKKLYKREKIGEMGDFIRDSGIIKGAPSAEVVLERTQKVNQDAGKTIGDIYKTLKENAPKVDADSLVDSIAKRINRSGAKPTLTSDAQAFTSKMDTLLADLKSQGESLSNPKAVNDLIGELDKKINYSLLTKEPPAVQQGYYAARDALRTHLKGVTRKVGNALGDKGLLDKYKAANDAYGKTKQIMNMAESKAAAQATNRMFSLTDYYGGIGGGVLGAAQGIAQGNPEEALKKGLLYGVGGAVANRAARRVGPGLLSQIGSLAPTAEKVLTPVEKAMTAGPVIKGLIAPSLMRGK